MLEERTQAMACEAALREGAAERLATAARPSRHSNDSLGSDGQPQG